MTRHVIEADASGDRISVLVPNRIVAWRVAHEILRQLSEEDDGCSGVAFDFYGIVKGKSMTFKECVLEVLAYPDFLTEYNRLRGTNLNRGGIEALIDRVTGKSEKDAYELFEFICEFVWCVAREKNERVQNDE